MNNIINIKPLAKEQARLNELVAEAKQINPYPNAVWDEFCWNIEGFGNRRIHDKRVLKIYFTRVKKNNRDLYEPFKQPFSDFAKMLIVTSAAMRGVGYSAQKATIDALRYLYETLIAGGSTAPSDLLPRHFKAAAAVAAKRRDHSGAYTLSTNLQRIAYFLDEHLLTPAAMNFKNPITKPLTSDGPDEKSQQKGLNKMPSSEALVALAAASNAPLDDDEKILLRTIDLLVAGGFRVGEVLSLPLNCWVEEAVPEENFAPVANKKAEEPLKRCGLRYIPEKGGEPFVKWLPDKTVPFAKRAVDDLIRLCAPAREQAAILEQNPDRVPLPGNPVPEELIDRNQIAESLGITPRWMRVLIESRLDLNSINVSFSKEGCKKLYRVADIERALLQLRAPLDVLNVPGKKVQKLSESLCVMFMNQFDKSKTTMRFLPQLVGYRQITTALGAEQHAASIFSRRGLKASDGSYLKIKTHAFRHWLNTMADQGGLSDMQLALWMGRSDLQQNAAYKHGTTAQRAGWAKEALKSGKLSGVIDDIYSQINDPAEKRQFLDTFVNAAHFTDYGVCLHDYALDPCKYHLNCLSGCGEFLRTKGDQAERRKIRELRVFTARQLEMAQEAMREDEFNANAWVEHNRTILEGCDTALSVDEELNGKAVLAPNEEKITVKTFPDKDVPGKAIDIPRF